MPQTLMDDIEPPLLTKGPRQIDDTDKQVYRCVHRSKDFITNTAVLYDKNDKEVDSVEYSNTMFKVRPVLDEFKTYEGGPAQMMIDLFKEGQMKYRASPYYHGGTDEIKNEEGEVVDRPTYKGLKEIFETQVSQSEKALKFDQVVVLKIGTFCGEVELGEQYQNSPYWQLAALEDMLDWLRHKCNIPPNKVFFQDPGLNEFDKAFLTGRGYIIETRTHNFSRITQNTLLYAPGNFLFTVFFGLAVAYPAIFVGDNLDWDESWKTFEIRTTDNDDKVNAFILKYREVIDNYRDHIRRTEVLWQRAYHEDQAILSGVVMWRP